MFLSRRKGNRRGLVRRAASTKAGRRTLRRLMMVLTVRLGRRLAPGAVTVLGARYFLDKSAGGARRKDVAQRIGGLAGRAGLPGGRKDG
jgi:hypothetical protein